MFLNMNKSVNKSFQHQLVIPSLGSKLAQVRQFVEKVAQQVGFSEAEVFDIKVAVGEACANAIEHGSPLGKANKVTIDIHYNNNCLLIEVKDEGVFKPRFPAFDSQLNYRGRGIPFMLALMDEVEIKESPHGTTVKLMKCKK